jgi:hypothetical protein
MSVSGAKIKLGIFCVCIKWQCYVSIYVISKCWLVLGWWSFAIKGFWVLWDNIYECVCYNRCHSNALKGFWVLWDNIYGYVCLLIQIFPSFLTGNLLVWNNSPMIRVFEDISHGCRIVESVTFLFDISLGFVNYFGTTALRQRFRWNFMQQNVIGRTWIGFHKRWRIYWQPEWLSASKEEICSMEIVYMLVGHESSQYIFQTVCSCSNIAIRLLYSASLTAVQRPLGKPRWGGGWY